MRFAEWSRGRSLDKARQARNRRRRPTAEALEGRLLLDGSNTSYLYQFGVTQNVAPGAVKVNLSQYTPAQGYGWTAFIGYGSYEPGPNPLLSDFSGGTDNSFRVDLPNGNYQVTAYMGAYNGYASNTVWSQGTQVGSAQTSPGQFYEPTFAANVIDGEITLRFTGGFNLDAIRIQAPLTVSAGPDQSVKEGDVVNLAGQSFAGTLSTFNWNFGDGISESGTITPQHVYTNAGIYTATLTATDSNGDQAQSRAKITVADVPPTAITGGPYSVLNGQPLTFSGSATDLGAAVTQAGFAYLWSFGDGSSSTLANPTHVYASPGNYPATLKVTASDGLSDTEATTVAVTDPTLSSTIKTPYDTIPNFVSAPSVQSVASGLWSSPSTWSTGRVTSSCCCGQRASAGSHRGWRSWQRGSRSGSFVIVRQICSISHKRHSCDDSTKRSLRPKR